MQVRLGIESDSTPYEMDVAEATPTDEHHPVYPNERRNLIRR